MFTQKDLTLIIPFNDDKKHLNNLIQSLNKYAKDCEWVFEDILQEPNETWDWLQKEIGSKYKNMVLYKNNREGKELSVAESYNIGAMLATRKVMGILHPDMILGPKYCTNILKHIKPKTLVCALRVEPPLHPASGDKIQKNFGDDFNNLNIQGFNNFCKELQKENNNKVSPAMFPPWTILREDYLALNGCDILYWPFQMDDTDFFIRAQLAGYEIKQALDAIVYHLTCRSARWHQGINKETPLYYKNTTRTGSDFIRKWGSWYKNDTFNTPTVINVYRPSLYIESNSMTFDLLKSIEPYFTKIYISDKEIINSYISFIYDNNLSNIPQDIFANKFISNISLLNNDSLVVTLKNGFTQNDINILHSITPFIDNNKDARGTYTITPCIILRINDIINFNKDLIKNKVLIENE